MTRRMLVAAAAGALAVGFLAGRWSVRPDPGLEARVKAYQADADSARRQRDAALITARAAVARADSLERAAATWEARARTAREAADRAGGAADGFRRLLADARTGADSLPLLVAECDARREECAQLRAANGHLLAAIEDERSAGAALRVAVDTLTGQVHRDAARLGVADALIRDLHRAARGCRVPLVGLPCPGLGLSWDATDGGLLAGADLPVGPVRLGVRWRVVR